MSAGTYTAMNAMMDIIASPSKALDEVKIHGKWFWWPLSIMILAPVLLFAYYFNWVDFPWLVDETVRVAQAQAQDADTAALIEERVRGFMSPTAQTLTAGIGITVVTFLIFTIQATYLNLVNKVVGDPSIRFGQWFSFSAWTAFVGIFAVIAMLVVILMADSNQVGQDQLNPLSMQSLFIHAELGSSWFNWGNSLALTNFWMLGLMAFGFHRWTGSSMAKSAVIVCIPWVLIFGLWALLIAL